MTDQAHPELELVLASYDRRQATDQLDELDRAVFAAHKIIRRSTISPMFALSVENNEYYKRTIRNLTEQRNAAQERLQQALTDLRACGYDAERIAEAQHRAEEITTTINQNYSLEQQDDEYPSDNEQPLRALKVREMAEHELLGVPLPENTEPERHPFFRNVAEDSHLYTGKHPKHDFLTVTAPISDEVIAALLGHLRISGQAELPEITAEDIAGGRIKEVTGMDLDTLLSTYPVELTTTVTVTNAEMGVAHPVDYAGAELYGFTFDPVTDKTLPVILAIDSSTDIDDAAIARHMGKVLRSHDVKVASVVKYGNPHETPNYRLIHELLTEHLDDEPVNFHITWSPQNTL